MTPRKPFPPRTLAEALDYYAGADYNNAINTAKKEGKEEARAEGRKEGRKEGLAEGKAEANMDNARMMKAKGFSAEVIAEITGLTIEEIETL